MSSLLAFTDDQLKAELKRREEEAKAPPKMDNAPNLLYLIRALENYKDELHQPGRETSSKSSIEVEITELAIFAFYGNKGKKWFQERMR